MGARIEAVFTTRSGTGLFGKGSVKLAVQAANGCLEKAGRQPNELDLIINTGVYRDENIGEPAISAFIQHQIGANLGYIEGENTTFNFDLSNGGCGLMNGIQLVDGFIESGLIRLGLIVTSDVDPDPKHTQGYDYVPAGAAILLSPGSDEEGFLAHHSETFPEYADLYESRVRFVDKDGRPIKDGKGINVLTIKRKKAFMSRCVDCAQKAVDAFMKEAGINVKDLDLVITSQSPPGFTKKFRVRMGLLKSRVVDVSEHMGNIHTAGPAMALNRAMEKGLFRKARTILFVTVGAGITVSLALYHNGSPLTEIAEVAEGDEVEGIYEDEP